MEQQTAPETAEPVANEAPESEAEDTAAEEKAPEPEAEPAPVEATPEPVAETKPASTAPAAPAKVAMASSLGKFTASHPMTNPPQVAASTEEITIISRADDQRPALSVSGRLATMANANAVASAPTTRPASV